MARPKSTDKRQAILDAALKIFADRGIAGAPTSAISREAGVAEGSLFTYFKTKDDLLNALYNDLRMEFSRHLDDFPHERTPAPACTTSGRNICSSVPHILSS